MAQRVRRRQDDDCAARSADPSLRNHRDRKRELALQAPRLSRCTAPACPGGQTGTPRAALRRTRGGHSAPRGSLLFATGTSLNRRPRGVTIGRRSGVKLQRRLTLFTRAVVAIDGSKFKAVNNRDKNYTVAKVTGRMEQVDASIARYLRALDQADREESEVAEAKSGRLKEKIAGLRRQMQALKVMEQKVQDAPDQQVSLTDPDARSMATSGKGTATVGYNVQIAVDAEHHLIVAHEVTNQGYDRH